jgi:hypothetical protein
MGAPDGGLSAWSVTNATETYPGSRHERAADHRPNSTRSARGANSASQHRPLLRRRRTHPPADPRERIVAEGPAALADHEFLAVLSSQVRRHTAVPKVRRYSLVPRIFYLGLQMRRC